MNSLAKTTWTYTPDNGGPSAQLAFGPNIGPPGSSGGNGTYTDSSGATPVVWVENGSSFMFQQQNQNPQISTLTTSTGTHANGAGSGWTSNFLINFSAVGFSITKNN